ncbi:PASTA domain-containing protein [Nesterenkonia salmonea]|uniref:non-specific serine/threonine protein kinase n=1 Tax=Nesterenkonia salmonea TaxID=1804987 RepID=A0A5R9BJZ6_9MICC|nr:PASTA domain-containing protein [Nesterenkonia salmonea]TLQ01026.1 PASTA domain-containing protein [Nesterenkonia salmonea]
MTERVLNGRYRIEALIGRGGMADVYRSYDLSLERDVAVKMLRPDLARDPMFQTRFKREAQSSASLNHPNVVGVYDTGSTQVSENGGDTKTPYIVMEFVRGVTLRHILHGSRGEASQEGTDSPPLPPQPAESTGGAARTDSDVLGVTDPDATQVVSQVTQPLDKKIDTALNRPLSDQEAARYMSGILAALSYSHTRGIVHRDIKPSNVMVSQSGDVKVMDFGIARALADSAQTMTQTSAVVGTAQYLSPEQARGEVVDHRSDLYSAGCVLFELLTNRPPFTGESPVSVAYQHVREQPPAVSDFNPHVSPAMESVVTKALIKDPALRFQTADEFEAALADALHGIPVDEGATTQLAAVGATGFDDVVSPAGAVPMSARTPEDPDYNDYQEYGQPRRRPNRTGLYILLVILALALLAGTTFVLSQMLGDSDGVEAEMVEVPAVAGMPEDEAVQELTDAGLSPETVTETSSEVEADFAIRTDPDSGTEVESGSDITLYISEGDGEVEIPEGLVGQPEDTVRGILEEAGLEVGTVTEEDDPDAPEGEVISTDPESGTSVESGSEVNLVISTGEVQLPSGLEGYVGQHRSFGEEFLVSEGFQLTPQPRWVETSDIDGSGELLGYEVNGQAVSSGDSVPNDAVIQIVAGTLPQTQEDDSPSEDEDDDEEEEDSPGNNEDEDDNGDEEDSGNDEEEEEEGDSPGNGNNGNGNGNGNNGNGNGNQDENEEEDEE